MIITNSVCWNTSCISDAHRVNFTWDGFTDGSWDEFFLCFYVSLFSWFEVLLVLTLLFVLLAFQFIM